MSSHLRDGADEEGDSLRIESPVAVYGATLPVTSLIEHWHAVLHELGVQTSSKAGSALAQIREALRIGVPRDAFERIRKDLGVNTEELAQVVAISNRTLARRTERFTPEESERLLRVASVVEKAKDVLENLPSARRWMTQPKRALGGLTPLRSCDTEVGAREVEALLVRLEHGVFS